jgi:uncharacterized protein
MSNFWEKEDWECSDKHLRALAEMPFQRKWPFIPTQSGLYIIRGPRQIGKTSWLKSILRVYAKEVSCYYLSCEEIANFQDLRELLRSLNSTRVILLDEVNFVDKWDRAVKHFVDSGYDGILCVTGSHAHDLEKGADLMPGRFGGGGEFHLLPMDFFEFETARRDAGWHSGDTREELSAYFRCGGFPSAIANSGKEAKIPEAIMSTYFRWLIGDIKKMGKDPDKLKEILAQLAVTMQSPVSFQTLAKKTSIGSPNTVIDYVLALESSFALRKLFAINIDTGASKFRSDKKFYFTDPIIYWIGLELAGKTQDAHEEALAEMVAHEHLCRRYKRFGYYRTDRGEVDFVSAGNWCVEVKWSPAALHLSKEFHKLQLPRKIVWTQKNFLQDWPSPPKQAVVE